MPPTVTPTTKIVPLEINKEFTPEDGWKLNSINDTVVDGKAQFFAVLIKMPTPPKQQPVNLGKENKKPKQS